MSASSEQPLNVAIVGCGQIMTHHLEHFPSSLRVKAAVDPSAERRRIILGLPAVARLAAACAEEGNNETAAADADALECSTLDELLESRHANVLGSIDIIFIAVPHDLHESIAMKALSETTCMVVMEKPLAPTLDACERLVQASLLFPGRLFIAEQSPYWQEVVLAKEMIRKGSIGTVVSAASYYYESMRDNVTSGSIEESGGLGWRGSLVRAGGGIAIDGGLHWIRPLREMCGRISKVVGITRPNLAPELKMEGEALGHALFEMEYSAKDTEFLKQPVNAGPLVATYSCNMLATAPMAHDVCPYFRITGTGGELVIHGTGLFKSQPGAGGLRIYNEEYPNGKELLPVDRLGGFFLGFSGLWLEIVRTCREKDVAAAHESVVRAADDVKCVLSLYKSAQTRQWEST